MVRVQGNILVSYRNYDSSKPIFSRTGINTRLKWTATIGARGISHSVRVERSRLLVQLSAFGFEWLKEIAFLAVKCHQKRAWGIKWPLCFCFVCLKSPLTHTAAVISQERVAVLFKVTGWWDGNGRLSGFNGNRSAFPHFICIALCKYVPPSLFIPVVTDFLCDF